MDVWTASYRDECPACPSRACLRCLRPDALFAGPRFHLCCLPVLSARETSPQTLRFPRHPTPPSSTLRTSASRSLTLSLIHILHNGEDQEEQAKGTRAGSEGPTGAAPRRACACGSGGTSRGPASFKPRCCRFQRTRGWWTRFVKCHHVTARRSSSYFTSSHLLALLPMLPPRRLDLLHPSAPCHGSRPSQLHPVPYRRQLARSKTSVG